MTICFLFVFMFRCFGIWKIQYLKHKKQDALYEALQKLKEGKLSLFVAFVFESIMHFHSNVIFRSNWCFIMKHASNLLHFVKPNPCALFYVNRTDAFGVHFPSTDCISTFHKPHMHPLPCRNSHASMQEGNCWAQHPCTLLSQSNYKQWPTPPVFRFNFRSLSSQGTYILSIYSTFHHRLQW